jgi:RNA polymerase sigma-70 factor (ECF subfamily)
MRERQPLLSELEDGALMAQVATGEVAALAELYDRYGDLVYSFLVRMLGDPRAAGDLLQAIFAQVWERASRFQSDRTVFDRWLLDLAHDLGVEEVRRRRGRRERVEGQEASEDEGVPAVLPSLRATNEPDRWAGVRGRIRDALVSLPQDQRRTIELCYFHGYTQEEIARLMGEPLPTVKGWLRLSLLRLRTLLELDDQRVDP